MEAEKWFPQRCDSLKTALAEYLSLSAAVLQSQAWLLAKMQVKDISDIKSLIHLNTACQYSCI